VTELVGKCDHQSAGWLPARHFRRSGRHAPLRFGHANESQFFVSPDHTVTDDEEHFDSEFENDGPRIKIQDVF